MPYTWRGPYPLRRVSCITRVSVSKLPKGPGRGRLSSVSLLGLYDPRMKRLFLVVVAVAVLAVSACGGDTEPQPPATAPSQPEVIEPATTAAVAVSTTAGEPSPLRAEAELAVAAHLAADAPGSVTDEQIACVASATVDALGGMPSGESALSWRESVPRAPRDTGLAPRPPRHIAGGGGVRRDGGGTGDRRHDARMSHTRRDGLAERPRHPLSRHTGRQAHGGWPRRRTPSPSRPLPAARPRRMPQRRPLRRVASVCRRSVRVVLRVRPDRVGLAAGIAWPHTH